MTIREVGDERLRSVRALDGVGDDGIEAHGAPARSDDPAWGGMALGAPDTFADRGRRALMRGRAWIAGDSARLAQGLGWFSVGVGLAELAIPEGVARCIGVQEDEDICALLRACGLRELASGVGILTTPEPRGLLWGRVAGDVMDLLLMGAAAAAPSTRRERLGLAAAAVLGVTALDVLAAQRLTAEARGSARERHGGARGPVRERRGDGWHQERARLAVGRGRGTESARGVHVKRAITVNRAPNEVYRFWRALENLPTFMSHLESVAVLDPKRSHWRAKAPAGWHVEWDAEITVDQADDKIAWRSLPGADVEHAGEVRFVAAPGGRGTEVHVDLSYRPPAGRLGAVVAKLFGEAPEQQIASDLRRFKQVLETGEVMQSDASIHRSAHPARPPARPAQTHARTPHVER